MELTIVVDVFNPGNQEQETSDHCRLEARIICIENPKAARAMQEEPGS